MAPLVDLRALVREPPAVVGRDEELAQVAGILARRQPALVLVAGDAGMGKSAFLRELEGRAVADGWAVARADEAGELAVTPSMSPADFDKRLRAILGLPPPAPEDDAVPALERPEEAKEPGFLAKVVNAAVRAFAAPWPHAQELIQALRERAPVLLLIDGYRPNDAFERAFALSLLPALKAGDDAVIVTVAERDEPLQTLRRAADAVIPFDRVGEDAIRPYFEEFARDVDPPLTPAELDEYVRAACTEPDLIGKLSHLLSLERGPER
jgi:hypothetical protein